MTPDLRPSSDGTPRPATHQSVLVDALDAGRAALPVLGGLPSIAVVHAYVSGAGLSESERTLAVGGADQVDPAVLGGFDYVALGHLHRPQRIGGSDAVAYSGSPPPLLLQRGPPEVGPAARGGGWPARRGDARCRAGRPQGRHPHRARSRGCSTDPAHERYTDHWVAARLTDDTVQTQPMERLRARFPHAVSLRYDDPRTGALVDFGSGGPPIEERSDEEVVLEFLEEVRDRPPSDSERQLVLDARGQRRDRGALDREAPALRLQAFGSYAGEFAIDFARLGRHGVFSITGPTGAGKSTIFDAIVYALYDDLPGFRVNSHIRSQFADRRTRTEVTLEFEAEGRHWVLTRSPAQSRPSGRVGSGLVDDPSTVVLMRGRGRGGHGLTSKRDVAERIADLVGLDKAQFEQVVLIPQGKFEEVLKAKTQERADLLAKLFPVDVYLRTTEALRQLAAERRDAYEVLTRGRAGHRGPHPRRYGGIPRPPPGDSSTPRASPGGPDGGTTAGTGRRRPAVTLVPTAPVAWPRMAGRPGRRSGGPGPGRRPPATWPATAWRRGRGGRRALASVARADVAEARDPSRGGRRRGGWPRDLDRAVTVATLSRSARGLARRHRPARRLGRRAASAPGGRGCRLGRRIRPRRPGPAHLRPPAGRRDCRRRGGRPRAGRPAVRRPGRSSPELEADERDLSGDTAALASRRSSELDRHERAWSPRRGAAVADGAARTVERPAAGTGSNSSSGRRPPCGACAAPPGSWRASSTTRPRPIGWRTPRHGSRRRASPGGRDWPAGWPPTSRTGHRARPVAPPSIRRPPCRRPTHPVTTSWRGPRRPWGTAPGPSTTSTSEWPRHGPGWTPFPPWPVRTMSRSVWRGTCRPPGARRGDRRARRPPGGARPAPRRGDDRRHRSRGRALPPRR